MQKNKLLLLLALLMTAATGAWAQEPATTYSVKMKDGTVDAKNWTIASGEKSAKGDAADGLTGLSEKETVTLQYNGRLKVKGVKATSDEAAAEALPALSITSPSVGQVIGSDGKNYAAASVPSGVTKVAMIAYVSGSNGLAIALADEGSLNWETAKSTCEAKTPAFTGGTWKLPSQDDWKQMFSANGGSDESYTGLNTAITTAGGTALPEFGVYWSSTPNGGDRAWLVNLYPGAAEWDYVNVSNVSRVRACLAFTVEQAAKPAATVTTAPTGAAVVGVGKTTALVSGGVADGGTMMYKVTTENTKPASTDGFSEAVPTAESITASGKVYVWYYVKGDDTHSDSEISATAIEVPVADIVWDVTNVSDLCVFEGAPYEMEGVTMSSNAGNVFATWTDDEDPTKVGIEFEAYETGGYTFTAPAGKAFTKIEMIALGNDGWDTVNLGTGWAFNNSTVTWKGTAAASTVELLTDDGFVGEPVKCIVFYLSE